MFKLQHRTCLHKVDNHKLFHRYCWNGVVKAIGSCPVNNIHTPKGPQRYLILALFADCIHK